MRSASLQLARTALFLALAVSLPIVFHQFHMGGRVFLPMHIPVILAGCVAGPVSGAVVGIISPGLSFVLTGMMPGYAVPLMSIELTLYGLIAGLAYHHLRLNIYLALLITLIVGRLGFALGLVMLGLFINLPYGVTTYFTVVLVTGLPGIGLQVLLIPPIVAALARYQKV